MSIATAFAMFAVTSAALLEASVDKAKAGTLYLTSCSGFGNGGNDTDIDGMVWQGLGTGDFSTSNRCPQGGSFQILPSGSPKTGESVEWQTVTPPSIQIVHALTPVNEVLIDPNISGDGYQAKFFWIGGTQTIVPENNCCGGMYYGSGINRGLGPSRWFGWQVTCTSGPCGEPLQILNVRGIQLEALDNTAPGLLALDSNNLWYQTGHWVRGVWPASFAASDDAGICGMQATIGGRTIPGPSDPTPNQHTWTQCPDPQTMNLTLDTSKYPGGQVPLTLSAWDAASPANWSSPSQTVLIDNQPVNLSLTGPSDAPSTAGTQYVTASASAGPSHVAGIACSEDGSPYHWHWGSSAQIPVQGIGRHQVFCYAQNNSLNSDGTPATSAVQSSTMTIREPTVFGIGFARVVDALRCHEARERVKVPARWVTVRRHHKLVRVRKRAHTKLVNVTRCHARTVRRRIAVWATIPQHGKRVRIRRIKLVRVVVLPHVVDYTTRHLAYGQRTTVGGWLGTDQGVALAGHPVWVFTAADNGQGRFRLTRVVTSRSDGSWSARLPAGPSRLVEAVYPGGATTEPAVSAQVRVVVPAVVRMHISPHEVPWGGTIQIWGRVLGGYIPGARQQLLRLRIGIDDIYSTVGIPDVRRDGRFHTTWTFRPGRGTVTYWFTVSTLREADYPFAPASSPRVYITVGPG